MPVDDSALTSALADCLQAGSTTAWEKFVALAQPIIASSVVFTLSRWGKPAGSLADDLIQDSFLKLCVRNAQVLRNFRGSDDRSLIAYLRTVASSTVIDYLNSLSTAKHGGDSKSISLDDRAASPVIAQPSPLGEIEANLILDRVEKCLSSHDQRERRIFWLYHRHGFSPAEIAQYPGIVLAKNGIETLVYRLTKAIRDCVKQRTASHLASEGVRA